MPIAPLTRSPHRIPPNLETGRDLNEAGITALCLLKKRGYTKSSLLLDFRRGAQCVRLCALACSLVTMGRVRAIGPVSTRPRRPPPPSFAQQSNFKVPMVLEKKLRVGFAGRRKKISVARESSLEKERGESLFSVLIKHRLIQNDIGVHFTGDGSLTLESLKVGKRKILGE